ncbi:hypothetical protein FQB35_03580 [Crassaminicella thermophila]|uniref:DUF5320 domain-containing protein n=1 Tax=Crassaminicella thermophila TaxID=2599308 RepID=A0A5C0SDX8_CRATE|nr:DUF5320 domain-containing protein [Crassaminicella thermophila]QEK11528.1 hypothetical protein FQB35_03580 [Crassaminicella thermophila]
MPRRDGTGPMGMGAMTGRRMGFCNTSRNLGRGLRLGLGCRFDYASSKDKKDILIEQKNFLEKRLNLIKKELEEYEE